MADLYLYADETGNMDLDGAAKDGSSPYFGFGTAIFPGEHGEEIWDGHVLRTALTERGENLRAGFHAKNDLWAARSPMLALIGQQKPRIDTTFLLKEAVPEDVRRRGQEGLYQSAWLAHLTHLCEHAVAPEDHLYAVVATLRLRSKANAARDALDEVCRRMEREITLCHWDASSAWGLQVADYALWAVHRNLVGRDLRDYTTTIQPLVRSISTPWGLAR